MVASVNFRRTLPGTGVFLALWLVAIISATAQNKVIRLRNEQIQTVPPDQTVLRAAQAPSNPVSGLYLVQFTGAFDPSWKEPLAAVKVDLLRYVPEDAYVVRLQETPIEIVRNLPFVQWIGPYRPEHKLHGVLQSLSQARNALDSADVSILLSPRASGADMAAVRALLSKVQQQSSSRFGAILRGKLAVSRLRPLAEASSVLWIEPAPKMRLNDEISTKIVAGEGPGHYAYVHQPPFNFTGTDVTVAVADSGLHMGTAEDMHPDLAGRTPAFFQYGSLTDASDEHAHGTHVAGIIAGNGAVGTTDEQGYLYGLGVAPGASIVTQRLFDGAGVYEAPPSYETLTREAVQAGAVIGNNSWGDDTKGRYDVSAMEFDALVRDADWSTPDDQPYILEFSAGNAGPGPQTIGSPAVAKNVIATGASQNDRFDFFIYEDGSETMADFSSRGPTEDGRIKPDVVAPGTWIASLRSPIADDGNAWLDIDFDYLYMGGTSQAGPQVSGAAAIFVQYYRESFGIGTPSPALVKAALIHSAVDMDDTAGTAPTPNMDEGWGRVDLTEIILNPRAHEYLDQTTLLTAGQTYERSVIIADSSEPLRVTLVYTDVPGFPAAIPALVNNLNLELIGPDGRVYRGNQFENGESVPDASSSDNLNNVEGIYIGVPAPGEYILRVKGANVVQDARSETPEIDQDFALVVSGSIPSLEAGIVLLDRARYTAPSLIRVKLFDLDLAGLPTATVAVKSASEPNGLTLTLRAFNTTGVLTGVVATAAGVVNTADSKLQIAHGDWIRVEYRDEEGTVISTANATADLVPPVISGVTVTNEFGQMIVVWATDEPATGIIRYGTNSTLSRAVTNNVLASTHALELDGLTPGLTYYFAVIATDAAGNTRTNNNGGALFSFVPVPSATVLLVDAYVATLEDIFIPLNSYTAALDETGVSYEVWSTESLGMPSFNDLRPYQIVMWRLNDSFNSADLIPAAQQNAIQQYLNGGGAFFMASMEILSRLLNAGSGAFVTNVLHVGRFLRSDPFCFCHCLDCDEDFRVPTAVGVEDDVVGGGLELTLNYSNYPSIEFVELGPDFSDTFGTTTNASPFLLEQLSGKACGVRFPRTGADSTGRVAFVSFPLDAIPGDAPAPNDRASFLRRVFQFLAPGLNGLGTVALNQESYRLPDQVTIEVGDSDLAGQASATVQIHSTSFTNRIAVTLLPTVKAGLFRGFVTVVSGTNAAAPGRLRANEGDSLVVEYFDASGQVTIQSTAVIDAVAPIISEVEVAAEYQDAVITWETSEPTDSLVQYGESAFLGKTAYLSDLEFSHSVQLIGLTPDRVYFYKVVSRDGAGNFVEDPNNGQLRTFQTRRPLIPPFVDTMQDGGTNWSVFNGEDTQFQWTVGSPQNGLVANTPSGDAMAWASNMQGDFADYIDTLLISPAIDLTGGNVARLYFNHAYDFTEKTSFDLEAGELLIVTNSISAPVTLATYIDMNGGWEGEEIDLTPYLGSVVFLIWHHQLLSFESANRPGWAVDDVSVVVTNVPTGTVSLSNNLAQARVALTGPVTRSMQGFSTNLVGLPPGQYVATWGAVQHYQSPPAQTNTLESDAVLKISGAYTFPDVNQNGMSDTWEQQFFGAVSPTRTCLTDTDGDGFPDCAEFAAGTSPVASNSFLKLNTPMLQATLNKLRFQWASSPGRQYQVQGSIDGMNWVPVSLWVQATGGTTSMMIAVPDPSEPFIFRLQVRP